MNRRYITVSEAKEILEKALKDRGELSSLQKMALQHAEETARLGAEDARKLVEELLTLEFMDEEHAVKIADLLPEHPDGVRAIYYKEFALPLEDIQKILEIVAKYR